MVEKEKVASVEKKGLVNFEKLGIQIPPLSESLIPIQSPDLETMPKQSGYAFKAAFNAISDAVNAVIEIGDGIKLIVNDQPVEESGADFCVPCHSLAKIHKKAPQVIATDFAAKIVPPPNIKKTRADKGFLNFDLDTPRFGNRVLSEVESQGNRYGTQNIGNGGTVVIDCSSPNIAKEMSVGHLRSTVIGEALARIYKASGYTVIRDNHLGDWGTQFGMLGEAYNRWGNEVAHLLNGPNPVKGLNQLYVKMNAQIEQDGGTKSPLYESGRQWFRRLEEGDPAAIDLWRWTVDLSMKGFNRVYELLGTKYEYALGESHYVGMLGAVVDSMVKNGVATKDIAPAMTDNKPPATVVHFTNGLGDLVVRKSDDTSVYATRDLAALAARTEWFHPVKILYVVGGEQKEYFKQVFQAFNMLAEGQGPEVEHVPFGMVTLGREKMSTRKGKIILLEDLLTEAISRAKEKVVQGQQGKERGLTAIEIDDIARKVGVGAVVFLDLIQGRERQISLDVEEDTDGTGKIKPDWDSMLSFEGKGAPYMQYAYARAQSILSRACEGSITVNAEQPCSFETPTEEALVKQMARFPVAIQRALEKNEPYIISDYVYTLAELYNQFYKREKIFDEGNHDTAKRNDRLRLTAAAAQVIKNALQLICIEAPERM